MTAKEILVELEAMGNPNSKKVLIKHGAKEPFFGVKTGDLKKIQKKIKKDHQLALELYKTVNSDAMYLAGLIADEKVVTKATLKDWQSKAYWYMINEYTVAWLASESNFGWELALEWIEEKTDSATACGWSTLSNWIALKADEELDINHLSKLLDRVAKSIASAQNREKYTMNAFVISVGTYVTSLTDKSLSIAKNLGPINVDMGGTACKVPKADDYIQKVITMGKVGKKKKKARC